ncbi:branched-chain amino acid ABC transporter permease [Natronorubrum bangense]|uniref:Branched-chain amino acid ABC transporter permease n=2 Tax=Natronorubrum bangense TaxID=61858 RepID=A0A4D6HHR7_9EURY|nr:branched-chain amino acid ABC transporter permease [Natronorubrum bangense]ELY43184.1 branched chain amino acid transporter permease [Natronorubrum bangense JCM 10635]QCC53280.1 branched-chain amino acid ABC transporter permease [Natronorubrum bangense]QCC56026.1 branched-chain amino acid ABC transporter permease [Natronorubrum bangense]
MSIIEYAANGLVYSSIIVLGSIGLSLIYSINGFANFAHGDTMTVGAYTTLVSFGVVGGVGFSILGLPMGFFVALLIGLAVAAVVAILTEKIVYEPLDIGSIGLLITSIGVAFVYRALIQMGFGSDSIRYDVGFVQPIETLLPYGIRLTQHDVAIVISATILVTGLHVLLQHTDLGRKMRAMADNPDLARASGIRTYRIKLMSWIIGAGLAGAGGAFLGLFNQLQPRMGFNVLLVIFAAVILGGIGSIYGAMLGGFLIGMVVEMMPLLSDVGIPIGIEYANAVAFLIMVAVLLVRPTGIAGDGISGEGV